MLNVKSKAKIKIMKIGKNFNSEVIAINIFIQNIARLFLKQIISVYTLTIDFFNGNIHVTKIF